MAWASQFLQRHGFAKPRSAGQPARIHTILDKLRARCVALRRMAAEDMRRLVGANFARLRREKGLTHEEVSARSGFSQQYLSGLEQGRRNPTVVTLYELAQAPGVGHLELLAPDRSGGGGKGGRPSGEPGPG